jgi:transposase
MIDLSTTQKVYLYSGYTDMRKNADGLLCLVNEMNNSEFTKNALFIFCSSDKRKIKVLQIDDTGVWVHYKRLTNTSFRWPNTTGRLLLSKNQLLVLLSGLSLIESFPKS